MSRPVPGPMPPGPLAGADPAAIAAAALAISRHLGLLADGMHAAATAFPAVPAGWQSQLH